MSCRIPVDRRTLNILSGFLRPVGVLRLEEPSASCRIPGSHTVDSFQLNPHVVFLQS